MIEVMKTNRKIQYSIALALIINLSACRFIVPTNKEASALNTQGSFSAGAPAWANLPKNQKVNLPANAGIIPQTFTVPESVAFSAQANASSAVTSNIGRGVEAENYNALEIARNNEALKKEKIAAQESQKSDDCEIGRIEAQCPGTENAVVEAIKTENISTRIKRYLILTKRCPSSASIWVWLAKDYSAIGRTDDARRCAQAAASIDPQNAEAQALLESLSYPE